LVTKNLNSASDASNIALLLLNIKSKSELKHQQ